MREEHYPRKDTWVPRLQSGTRVANLQRERASNRVELAGDHGGIDA